MIYDLAVVGGGPAGCSAAITAANRDLATVLFDPGGFGPALRKAEKVTNYPGLPDASGQDLMNAFTSHMRRAGTEVVRQKILSIMALNDHFYLAGPSSVTEAKSVILAIGVPHSPTLEGEEELLGRGVSYCAVCDGNFYRGRSIGVICTVSSLWHDVEFLAGLASSVTCWLSFKAPGVLPENIHLRKGMPRSLNGEDGKVLVDDGEPLFLDGLFILRESDPAVRLMPGIALKDRFIRVGDTLETSVPGVFAAGDCIGRPLQIAKAVGEGQKAALGAFDFIRKQS
jgi:thioredoxin reductase (NADPH)